MNTYYHIKRITCKGQILERKKKTNLSDQKRKKNQAHVYSFPSNNVSNFKRFKHLSASK